MPLQLAGRYVSNESKAYRIEGVEDGDGKQAREEGDAGSWWYGEERRVVERLEARGAPVRVGSRSGEPPFDWEDRATWASALRGVGAVYVSYYPGLAVPGSVEAGGFFRRTPGGNRGR